MMYTIYILCNSRRTILITLWKENKTLCIITFISIIIVLSYNLTLNMPELIPGIGIWFTLLYDLCIGVLINFIFFIYQLFLPSYKHQKKAFSMIKPNLEKLYFDLSDIFLATNKFVKLTPDNSIEFPNRTSYFIRHDIEENGGWLIRVEFTLKGIQLYNRQIEKTLSTITGNSLYADNEYELLKNLALLQSNQYLNYLMVAVQNPYDKIKFGNLQDEYRTFQNLTLYLGKLVNQSCLEISDVSENDINSWENNYNSLSSSFNDSIPRQYTSLNS